jgi:putative transposase
VSTKKSQLRSHSHCVFSIHYHIVFVTKYRRKCFTKEILARLGEICGSVCSSWDVDLLEFGGESDHIHLLVETHPNVEPAKFVNNLKTVSSRMIRKEYSDYLAKYYWKPVLWTRAYCILSAGGAPLDIIKAYVENQGVEKKARTKK